MSNMLNQPRRSYQHHDGITIGRREPFAGRDKQILLRNIVNEATKASEATTQAAYLLRLDTLRQLLRIL